MNDASSAAFKTLAKLTADVPIDVDSGNEEGSTSGHAASKHRARGRVSKENSVNAIG